MSLTALEWGLRAPITPRFGGNLEALSRALKIPNQNNNKKPTSNTKNRIAPSARNSLIALVHINTGGSPSSCFQHYDHHKPAALILILKNRHYL